MISERIQGSRDSNARRHDAVMMFSEIARSIYSNPTNMDKDITGMLYELAKSMPELADIAATMKPGTGSTLTQATIDPSQFDT